MSPPLWVGKRMIVVVLKSARVSEISALWRKCYRGKNKLRVKTGRLLDKETHNTKNISRSYKPFWVIRCHYPVDDGNCTFLLWLHFWTHDHKNPPVLLTNKQPFAQLVIFTHSLTCPVQLPLTHSLRLLQPLNVINNENRNLIRLC